MDAVLGIDAAWTENRPSGVAVVKETAGTWTCVGVAPSYEAFLALPQGVKVDWEGHVPGVKARPWCASGDSETPAEREGCQRGYS